jgi:hypothetical protein
VCKCFKIGSEHNVCKCFKIGSEHSVCKITLDKLVVSTVCVRLLLMDWE